MAREINLVPDVKGEMIKALKLRNFIFFCCIMVAIASIAVTLIFGGIAIGQQSVVDAKKETISTLSDKINSYSDLNDFLTIKDQLGNLSSLDDNKKLLSRTFGILSALLPTGADSIIVSELNISLANDSPTIAFDAQANAGEPPYIDYNVLESFKKSMQYMRYDYGNYVDKYGNEIPAYCIVENDASGATFSDSANNIYAYWLINGEGCNPQSESTSEENTTDNNTSYNTEEYAGQTVVRIWRTPQYDDWYKEKEVENQPYMGLDGTISGVPHFESQCIKYEGTKNASTNAISWTSTNEECLLVPGGIDGIKIGDSSNGRGSDGDLVLRFSATITLSPEYYSFRNKHMLAIGPNGRYNVTDSYVQIQDMFGKRATDCSSDDTACNNTTNGGNN